MIFKKNKTQKIVSKDNFDKVNNYLIDSTKNREDKKNMCPISVSDREFVSQIKTLFLGADWYVVDPIAHEQINTIILDRVLYLLEITNNIK